MTNTIFFSIKITGFFFNKFYKQEYSSYLHAPIEIIKENYVL